MGVHASRIPRSALLKTTGETRDNKHSKPQT
jgi:hypothetical protein